MDKRVLNNLTNWINLSVSEESHLPYIINISEKRTDEPYNRFVIHRNLESRSIYSTCIPRLYDQLKDIISKLSSYELFSSYGLNVIKNILNEEEASVLGQGFGYSLNRLEDFNPFQHSFDIHLSEVLEESQSILPRKTYCIVEGIEVSSAYMYVRDTSGIVAIDVETKNEFRGKGIGCAVVSDAVKWLLENDCTVYYGANINNVHSLRIAKKLGFQLVSQHIVA